MSGQRKPSQAPGSPVFATTHWSVVLTAASSLSGDAADAMESLCRLYWYPLYAFVRRRGHAPHDAQDLTQSFFVHVLQSNLVNKARRDKGRFRSFLLASFKNFISVERNRVSAQKRGGGKFHFSLDEHLAEGRYADELTNTNDPARLYERAWARTVLEEALRLLESDYGGSDKHEVFERLHVFLLGDRIELTYAEVAAELGTSESAVKMMVQRLRRRYRECLRAVIADTVATASEIEEELGHLVEVLARDE